MVQPSLTGLDYQKLLSWYGFHEDFKKVIKVFAPCLKNEAVNQLKANFIYWKATRVSLDYTHPLAVCAHFERHLPLSLWTMVLQTSESVHHLNL